MTITIKTPTWTVRVMDADTTDWTYRVLRGSVTTADVVKALKAIRRNK